MSDKSTIAMIDMYLEESSAPAFLSGFFQSPPQNFHTTEDVEIDIQRDSEQVAIVIKDLSLPPNHNENSLYTNKRLKPPIYDEEGAVTAFDMIQRMPGENPFQNPNYAANAVKQSFAIFRKLESKIRRAIELQASQVLQTGQLNLIDKNGVAVYTIDFSPKASHLVTPGAVWAVNGATGDPLGDIASLTNVIRRDGKREPKRAIFGAGAFARFLANPKVVTALDSLRGMIAQVAPEVRGQGATFQGWVWVGHYRLEMWTYDGFYQHPQTGAFTTFVADNKVILNGDGRLDLTYGAIPMILAPDQRAMPFLPPRISSASGGLDLTTNAWCTPDGKRVMVSAGTRPLTIPTAIDTFGCLTVF